MILRILVIINILFKYCLKNVIYCRWVDFKNILFVGVGYICLYILLIRCCDVEWG